MLLSLQTPIQGHPTCCAVHGPGQQTTQHDPLSAEREIFGNESSNTGIHLSARDSFSSSAHGMTNTGEHNPCHALSSTCLFPWQEGICNSKQLRSCPVLEPEVSSTELLHGIGLQHIYNFEQLFEKGSRGSSQRPGQSYSSWEWALPRVSHSSKTQPRSCWTRGAALRLLQAPAE